MARHSIDSRRETVRHGMDDPAANRGSPDQTHDDTILHHSHAHNESVAASPPVTSKVCTLCGADVAGRKRYKDRAGHYYCEGCFPLRGEASARNGNPARPPVPEPEPPAPPKAVACPDCGEEVDPILMVDFKGTSVCASCAHARGLSLKREAARIAAAEEEARRQVKRRQTMITFAIVVLGLLAIYGAMQVIMS